VIGEVIGGCNIIQELCATGELQAAQRGLVAREAGRDAPGVLGCRAMRATHKGRTRRVQTSVVLLLLVCAACTPRGPFAGGPLSGKPGPAHVASWEFAADEEVLELETRPEDPRSVTLWFWADGPSLYVASSLIGGTKEPSERTWVAHITGNPRVRILIRGLISTSGARVA
jgi:hypothetical protein